MLNEKYSAFEASNEASKIFYKMREKVLDNMKNL